MAREYALAKEGLMSYRNSSQSLPQRFSLVLRSFLQHSGLPFSEALPEDEIQKVFDKHDVGFAMQEDEVYCPAVTLWAFLFIRCLGV